MDNLCRICAYCFLLTCNEWRTRGLHVAANGVLHRQEHLVVSILRAMAYEQAQKRGKST